MSFAGEASRREAVLIIKLTGWCIQFSGGFSQTTQHLKNSIPPLQLRGPPHEALSPSALKH